MIKSSIYPIKDDRCKRAHQFIAHISFPENHCISSNVETSQSISSKNNPTQKQTQQVKAASQLQILTWTTSFIPWKGKSKLCTCQEETKKQLRNKHCNFYHMFVCMILKLYKNQNKQKTERNTDFCIKPH